MLIAGTSGAPVIAEYYAAAKTSVWWDMENCQIPGSSNPYAVATNIIHALISSKYSGPVTIFAYGDTNRIPDFARQAPSLSFFVLNHVPTGAQDACSKKILVDMLFWAADNPPPANYLLISGNEDFVYAIHRLRTRGYNILVDLFNSATLMRHLTNPVPVHGGFPSYGNAAYPQATMQNSAHAHALSNQPPCISGGTLLLRAPESQDMQFIHQPPAITANKLIKAPHEFSGATSDAFTSSRPTLNLFPVNTGTSHTLSEKEPVFSSQNRQDSRTEPAFSEAEPVFSSQSRLDFIPKSAFSLYKPITTAEPSSSHSEPPHCVPPANVPGNSVLESDDPIGLALNTLKVEMIMPTEDNIVDCIRYGDSRYSEADARKAFQCALDQGKIVKEQKHWMVGYVRRTEVLWPFLDPHDGHAEEYSEATWDEIKEFLTSSAGRSALMTSQCRYEAALILKSAACLNTQPLGEVVQILNMIITRKKWIEHADLGWQPITIKLPETEHNISRGS